MRDYNVCLETEDGKHVPQAGYDPEQSDGYATVECAVCGLMTGLLIPEDVEWN